MRRDAHFPMRLRFAKRGRVRFISHRDVARAFERAFRIEQLPLGFTGGFSPRPRVSFGLALSVGHESDAEYVDVELTEPVDVDAVIASLTTALPEGIDVTGGVALADRVPALQEAVTSVVYRVDVEGGGALSDLGTSVDDAMSAASLLAVRRRKGVELTENVRPAIRRLHAVGSQTLELEVATQPHGVRPESLVAALHGDWSARSVLRTHQWIERDGARREPLDADARPHVPEARAS